MNYGTTIQGGLCVPQMDPNIQQGFGAVNVKKTELLEKLQANKTKHEKEVEKATELYKKAKREYLNTLKEQIETRLQNEDPDINTNVRMLVSQPVSYAKQYDSAIKMLEMSTSELVYLNSAEFNQYVLDDWAWKQNWANNNMTLISGCHIAAQ